MNTVKQWCYVDLGKMGVHQIFWLEDETGRGMTCCGLKISPINVEVDGPSNCVACAGRTT